MLQYTGNTIFNIKTEKGFRELFEMFYQSLYYYAKQIVKDEDAADDITQEVFINIWDKRNDLKIHAFAGFLYTSVRLKCMNYIRTKNKKQSKHVELSESVMTQIDDRLFLVEEEMVREINKLINSMPEQRQRVFKMHVDGMEQKVIADELGVSINTVKTHKLKAKQFLREQLKNSLYLLFLVKFENFF